MFIIVQIPALYLSALRNILFFIRPSKSIKNSLFYNKYNSQKLPERGQLS